MFPPAMRRRSIRRRRRQHREDIHDLTSYAPEATMGSLREVQGVRQKTSRLPHQAYQSIAVRSLGTQTTLHANSTPRQRALQKLKMSHPSSRTKAGLCSTGDSPCLCCLSPYSL